MDDGRMDGDGRLEAIWRKRARRGPMDPLDRAELVAGRGLVGNADQGGRRQVTIVAAEAWERAEADLGRRVGPDARRANLLVRGIELRDTRERTLAVGSVRILVGGETTPCYRMDEAADGLQEALRPEWRGGVYGRVVEGGAIEVGDPVRWMA
ncbi:MAG TPA: MOSC domain-containing protein [Gemmatimonadota bacterium]|nr:MOSC domain-containing protein [Gemmatimonadota bacterium]